ncbi:MAG: trypsin-like peptidase domain-containing protein [Gemmatimonadaceae bacterium]
MKRLLLLVALLVVAAPTAGAQGRRAELLQQATAAYDDFDAARALRLVRTALDPALGPLDTTWVRGVHLLTQILIDEDQGPLATTWARWAMRLEPSMTLDTVNFVAEVVTTMREARATAARTAGDDATRSTHDWPSLNDEAQQGRFRVAPSPVPVNLLVVGRGLITAGPGMQLPAGSYELEASASGFLPARLTREVLPGVTINFSFTLTPAAAAAATLAADVRSRVARAIVPLNITRFGMPAACAAGVTAGGDKLVLTSYHAIRGADAIVAGGGAAGAPDAIRVAAWDVTANLAILVVPTAPSDTLPLTTTLTDGQALFGIGLAECRTANESRVLLDTWAGRPTGVLQLSTAPTLALAGSPLVDYQGTIAGIWAEGPSGVPAAVVTPLIARARVNIAARQLRTPQEVALAERHRYGAVVIAADVPTARIKVTPIEAWHWEGLIAEGAGPLTFSGPAGRYRVEVSAPDATTRTQEITIIAGERTRAAVSLRQVAGGPGVPAARGRGLPRWAWFAIIGGGAGVAALALGGGGGGGESGGSIGLSVPNP